MKAIITIPKMFLLKTLFSVTIIYLFSFFSIFAYPDFVYPDALKYKTDRPFCLEEGKNLDGYSDIYLLADPLTVDNSRFISRTYGSGGGNYTVTLRTSQPGTINVQSSQGWISATRPLSDANVGGVYTVSFSLNSNPEVYERRGRIEYSLSSYGGTIQGRATVEIIQAGTSIRINPTVREVVPKGEKFSVDVAWEKDCWSVQTNESWLQIVSPPGGCGSNDSGLGIPDYSPFYEGFVEISALPNLSRVRRTGYLNFTSNGRTITLTVSQNPEKFLEVSPPEMVFPDRATAVSSSNQSITIQSNISWRVSSNVLWINLEGVSPGGVLTGSNDRTIKIGTDLHSGSLPRTGKITINGDNGLIVREINVTQDGDNITDILEVDPTSLSFSYKGGEAKLNIAVNPASNPDWSYQISNNSWLSARKVGNQLVVNATANNDFIFSRNNTITITSGSITKNIPVGQAKKDKFNLSQAIHETDHTSKTLGFSLDANVAWKVVSINVPWITLDEPSNGQADAYDNSLRLNISSNTTTKVGSRRGQITLAPRSGDLPSLVIFIIQHEAPYLDATPSLYQFRSGGGLATIGISTNQRNVQVSGLPNWLTSEVVQNPGAYLKLTALPNPTNSERSQNITLNVGGILKIVQILQDPADFLTVLPANILQFDAESNLSKTFEIQSNVEWEIIRNVGWINYLYPTSDEKYKSVSIVLDPNSSTASRQTDLIIRSTTVIGLELAYRIYQNGAIPNVAPNSVIRYNPSEGEYPLTVNFTGEDSYDQDGDISAYFWDFGDGSNSSATNP